MEAAEAKRRRTDCPLGQVPSLTEEQLDAIARNRAAALARRSGPSGPDLSTEQLASIERNRLAALARKQAKETSTADDLRQDVTSLGQSPAAPQPHSQPQVALTPSPESVSASSSGQASEAPKVGAGEAAARLAIIERNRLAALARKQAKEQRTADDLRQEVTSPGKNPEPPQPHSQPQVALTPSPELVSASSPGQASEAPKVGAGEAAKEETQDSGAGGTSDGELTESKWRYISRGRKLGIRSTASCESERNGAVLEPGEVFRVIREQPSDDGTLFLCLADGRGWVFDKVKDRVLCFREAEDQEQAEQGSADASNIVGVVAPQHTEPGETSTAIKATVPVRGRGKIAAVPKQKKRASKPTQDHLKAETAQLAAVPEPQQSDASPKPQESDASSSCSVDSSELAPWLDKLVDSDVSSVSDSDTSSSRSSDSADESARSSSSSTSHSQSSSNSSSTEDEQSDSDARSETQSSEAAADCESDIHAQEGTVASEAADLPDSNGVPPPATQGKKRSAKQELVAQVLCRWWYVLPPWPAEDFDYEAAVTSRGLRCVPVEAFGNSPDQDERGRRKVYEIPHYPGLYRDVRGALWDVRPVEGRPSYDQLMLRSMPDLQQLVVQAYEKQLAELMATPCKTSTDEEFRVELRKKVAEVKQKARFVSMFMPKVVNEEVKSMGSQG